MNNRFNDRLAAEKAARQAHHLEMLVLANEIAEIVGLEPTCDATEQNAAHCENAIRCHGMVLVSNKKKKLKIDKADSLTITITACLDTRALEKRSASGYTLKVSFAAYINGEHLRARTFAIHSEKDLSKVKTRVTDLISQIS
ncbi:hypothetical protein [Photobacterium kishitanii]|uniref:Uncharacterized protein n=1 Tax=Photobacterium kishitanii TaxID=318456 RepID=A0A2T3KKW8_9GAMM|nr:hypothetical protein [Photobacterium kishitanii]PSV00352.1 hypothetical protein C9J27_04290 [Photobacterium kishitanii]